MTSSATGISTKGQELSSMLCVNLSVLNALRDAPPNPSVSLLTILGLLSAGTR